MTTNFGIETAKNGGSMVDSGSDGTSATAAVGGAYGLLFIVAIRLWVAGNGAASPTMTMQLRIANHAAL
jgi:hypothetical protein